MDFSSLLGLAGPLLNFFGASQANKQNMLMNTGAWKAQQISQEAQMLGVSPLALLGQSSGPTPAQNVFADAGSLGQNLSRAAAPSSPADQRMQALREQNLMLQNANLQNDVVAGQLRNSTHRVTLQPGTPPPPPTFTLDDVWGRLHPGTLAPKPGLQAILRPDGKVYYVPSAVVQQGLWSPVPGIPANPQATSDVVRANAADIPPDVARMTGAPPGAYQFVPGTAPGWGDAAREGRDDRAIYGNPIW